MPPRKSAASDVVGDTSIISNASVIPDTEASSPSTSKNTAKATVNASTEEGQQQPSQPQPKKVGVEKRQKNNELTIDDLLMPRTLMARIARGSLPPNTQIQRDALTALTKSATVFISALANTANSLTSRKTIQPADVIEALKEMELAGVMGLGSVGADGRLGGRLERELSMFEEGVKGKRKGYNQRAKARKSLNPEDGTAAAGGDAQGEDLVDRGEGHARKRVRIDGQNGDTTIDASADDEGADATEAADAQLRAENENNVVGRAASDNDATETDPEGVDEDNEEEVEEEEDDDDVLDEEEEEEEEDEEDEEEENEEPEDDEAEIDDPRISTSGINGSRKGGSSSRKNVMLSPNGRAVLDGDGDTEDDSD